VRLHLLGGLATRGHAGHQKQRWPTPGDHGGAACAVCHGLLALGQRALQPGTVVAAEHGRQHQQRQRVAVAGLQILHAGEGWHAEREGHIGLLCRSLHGDAAQAALLGLGAGLALGHRMRG